MLAPTVKVSPSYLNNVENPEDEILDQKKSFAKGYKRTEFGKSKSNEQIALDVKTDRNIITLYNLFAIYLGGETGFYIILNILEMLDISLL